MNHVGEPWLSRSVTSGSARQIAHALERVGADIGRRVASIRFNAGHDPARGRRSRRDEGPDRRRRRAVLRPRPAPPADARPTGGPQDVADTIAETIREAAAAAETEPASSPRSASARPATSTTTNGIVTSARNLPGWEGSFPLAGALQDALGPPVSLGNDVNVATMAEFHLGAGQPYSSLLGVFWGTGVGGGVVLDGKLWLGRDAAGEIGHMVVKVGGAKCPCGRHGCMEAYAGRGGDGDPRPRAASRRASRPTSSRSWRSAAATGSPAGIWARALVRQDPMAVRLVDRAIEALGAGVASAVNLLDVEAVIVGGGLGVRLGDPYRKRLEHAMQPHVFADTARRGCCSRSSATSAARSAPRCSPARRRPRRPEPPRPPPASYQ